MTMLNVYVLRILLAALILRKPARTQPIELNGSATCICIAHLTCGFNPGTHLPLSGTAVALGEKSPRPS